jgi:hypothetical protein
MNGRFELVNVNPSYFWIVPLIYVHDKITKKYYASITLNEFGTYTLGKEIV